jgi:glycosyltransferase involved in cell wall biosynthesis
MRPNSSEPLRIIQLVRAPIGGIRLHVCLLLETLRCEQRLVTSIDDGDAVFKSSLIRYAAKNQLIDLKTSELPSVGDFKNLFKLFFELRKFKPQILHGHGAKGGMYARLLAPLMGAKSVYSPHGGSLHAVFSRPKRWLYMAVEKALQPLTSALIFESDYSRQRYFENVAPARDKSHLIPNGLRLPSPAASERSSSSNSEARKFIIGTFGSLRPVKGQDILIRAATIVAKIRNDFEIRVYGEGPSHADYVTLINELGLSASIKLMGDTPEPLARMAECDLVVQPSRFESFGYTAVEAMALGIPLLASAVGGLKEIIQPNVNGTLVSELTPQMFANQILELMNQPEKRNRMAMAAISTAKASYGVETMSAKILEVYNRII